MRGLYAKGIIPDTIAARSGVINKQTAWVLNYLNIDVPFLLTDASPRFEAVARSYDSTTPDRPLKDAWEIFSRTNGIAPIVDVEGNTFRYGHRAKPV